MNAVVVILLPLPSRTPGRDRGRLRQTLCRASHRDADHPDRL